MYASRVAELMELRTRLEGSLERVERMTDSLERAAARVAAGQTGGVSRLLLVREEAAMNDALASVEKMASREAELQPWLERFSRAEAQLRSALLKRTAEIGVYEGQSLELARLLERETVLYRGSVFAWRQVAFLIALASFIVFRLTYRPHGYVNTFWVWLVPVMVASSGILWRIFGPRLVVTPGFVRIGKEVLRVVDVKTLRITRKMEGRGRSRARVHIFAAESPSGMVRHLDQRVSVLPDAFIEALVQVGIEVRRESID